jgi:hypothetical protein
MRRWTWSLGVSVVVVAFLIGMRCARGEAPSAEMSIKPIESATPANFISRLVSPHSSTDSSIQTVAILPRKSVNFPKSSLFRPKAPNIHAHPPKKSKMWYPFGHK